MPIFRAQGIGKMPKDQPPPPTSVTSTISYPSDGDLPANARQIFSQVYQKGGAIGNPCFWGEWTAGEAVAGGVGAIGVNFSDITASLAEAISEKGLTWALPTYFNMSSKSIPAEIGPDLAHFSARMSLPGG